VTSPVVLITGGLTGIGRATALAFAGEGARIVISGRREEAGRKLIAELGDLGSEAEFVRCDVRHEEDVRRLVDRTVARFGRLDVAVNCAGTEGKPGLLVMTRGRPRLPPEFRSDAWGSPKRSPRPSCFSHRRRRLSSPVR
jgi:NAD(P)-dependent dehydrogenase (short-subunit alcohol dehydrogenase family)